MAFATQPIPITINGNTLVASESDEPSTVFSLNAANSNYITLQTQSPLTGDQKQELEDLGVQLQEYVSENTYLCRYEPINFAEVKAKSFVNHIAEFDRRFKVEGALTDSLSAAERSGTTATPVNVEIELHQMSDRDLEQTKADISEKTGIHQNDIVINGDKISVPVEPGQVSQLESLDSIKSIYEVVPTALFNNFARKIIHAELGINGTPYTGKSQVVAVADTGFDTGDQISPHPAFTGRIRGLLAVGRPDMNMTDDPHGHGTHVSGSVLGNGYSERMGGQIRGTAPDAELVMQSLWTGKGLNTSNILDLFVSAADRGAFIHSNSWGVDWKAVGKQVGYDPSASTIDKFVVDNPGFLICFAAGNDGQKASRTNAQIGSYASAKNCLTVGATESSRPSVNNAFSPNKETLNDTTSVAPFSSRGPTTQGRIKPDVMAPGTAILSAQSRAAKPSSLYGKSEDRNWSFNTGTSMATPLVAGCAAILRQSLIDTGSNSTPSAALIKAMLINGAVDVQRNSGPVQVEAAPNSVQGFGRVDLANSIIVPGRTTEGFLDGVTLRQEQAALPVFVDIPSLEERLANADVATASNPLISKPLTLRVTLAYTDKEGALLQSDLSLIVVAADGVRRNGNMGTSNGTDNANNVERVVWYNIPGGRASIFVHCKRTTTLLFDQPYALVWKLVTEA
ncbi:MAG: hypothetical protein L6R41_001463 [Letrouitia leprolyta]|nr:MAG: hypothetical protein L6R41_001463 [Letrouitia leprolyta]